MRKPGFQSKEVGCFNRVEGNTKAELEQNKEIAEERVLENRFGGYVM